MTLFHRPGYGRFMPSREPRWRLLVPGCAAVGIAVTGCAASAAPHAPGMARPDPGTWSAGASVPAAPGPVTTASGPPRYYADIEDYGRAVVRSTATGAVTADVPSPGRAYAAAAVAAAADDRTFFVDYDYASARTRLQTRVYRFQVTASGQVSGFALVNGGVVNGESGRTELAAAPDGSLIAFDSTPAGVPVIRFDGVVRSDVVVIDTRTGKHSVWQGSERPGWTMFLSSLSFTRGGRSLVVLEEWCKPGSAGNDSCLGSGNPATEGRIAEVWAIDPARGGGRVDGGSLLLRQSARYPYVALAVITQDGRALIALLLSGGTYLYPKELTVARISVATGLELGVLFHSPAGGVVDSSLSLDGSGQYVLLGVDYGHHGWIYRGHFHVLPPTNGDGVPAAW